MITAINNIYVQTIHIWYDARMIVVIIAGGSGTRLWPLSTNGFPKHLLALTNEKSLLQNTFERVQGLASVDRLFVITEVSHAEHVKQQLPNILSSNIIIEPGRRGTATAGTCAGRSPAAATGLQKDCSGQKQKCFLGQPSQLAGRLKGLELNWHGRSWRLRKSGAQSANWCRLGL